MLDKYRVEPVGTSLPKLDSAKVAFPNFTPERFRQPFDTCATRVLQRLFPFEFLIREGLGTIVEQAMFLDNLSTAVRVGPKQLPKIYNRFSNSPSSPFFVSSLLAPLSFADLRPSRPPASLLDPTRPAM